jgi:hypothetical protein
LYCYAISNIHCVVLFFAIMAATAGHAIQVCELNGDLVNPANSNTTAGKNGLMRCRDGEGGTVARE